MEARAEGRGEDYRRMERFEGVAMEGERGNM